MRAMQLDQPGRPLGLVERPALEPGPGEVVLRVSACGVCRTDLHIVDGELPPVRSPLVPGHEIVGVVNALGAGVTQFTIGDRAGVPWLGWTCGECRYCLTGRENLCDDARFTGYHVNGGYADEVLADARYCFALPDRYSDVEAAPLLCAGLIGYRALRAAGAARVIGIYGFGAAAHIVCQVAVAEGRRVHAFTRPGDEAGQGFAREMGAVWAGDSTASPPEALDAAILFAPVGALVPAALASVRKGGIVVCGGIHMSDIPSFAYELLWGERRVISVANLTRRDGLEFLDLAARVPIRIETSSYALAAANDALQDLRTGRLHGAAVLVPGSLSQPAITERTQRSSVRWSMAPD